MTCLTGKLVLCGIITYVLKKKKFWGGGGGGGGVGVTFGMGSCSETEVKCYHNVDSRLRIVKICSNCGKKLNGCSLWLVSGKNYYFYGD